MSKIKILVEEEDLIKLMTRGVELLERDFPELVGIRKSRSYMFKRAVKRYLSE